MGTIQQTDCYYGLMCYLVNLELFENESFRFYKGPVINYREGGGGYTNGKLRVRNVKLFLVGVN